MMDLRNKIKERIILKDGSIGVCLSKTEAGKKVPFYEILNVESPDTVFKLHLEYIDFSSDLITTNSFSAHPISLRDWGFEDRAYEINFHAAKLARDAVKKSGRDVLVLGSMGPTAISMTMQKKNQHFNTMKSGYKLQAKALLEGGADIILIETIHDPINAKAASHAVLELIDEGYQTEIALSLTVELTGYSLSGQSIESFVISNYHLNPIFLGLNCAFGPNSLIQPLKDLEKISPVPVAFAPNAGLPNESGNYNLTPEIFANQIESILDKCSLNIVGGCCGTSPEHIRYLRSVINKFEPRKHKGEISGMIAGLEAVALDQNPKPMIIGEQANTLGSRDFKKIVQNRDIEKVTETLRKQSISGAHALDICFASVDSDELEHWKLFAPEFAGVLKLPLFIDTTRLDIIEYALEMLPGKPVLNSINLEDGGGLFNALKRLMRKHAFAAVVGLIDESGMAKNLKQKLTIAERSVNILTENGFDKADIILDPLVFPLTTEIDPYITIDAIRALKIEHPECPIILGISNISFGLPKSVRQLLNSAYLEIALDAGLDIAIIKTKDLSKHELIDIEDKLLAIDILKKFNKDKFHSLINKNRDFKIGSNEKFSDRISPDDQLIQRVITGMSDGIERNIRKCLLNSGSLDIINGPLMTGMDRVSELFQNGRMIISEVLLSAGVFKSAMTILMRDMKDEYHKKAGKIILATVKGDVHDIGRNLVGMILESNGFEIIDLGTKVSPEKLIDSIIKDSPDAVGLSGLLIRSAYIMKETVEAFSQAGINIPVVVGGAALTQDFTNREIAPFYNSGTVRYAKDALDGLRIIKEIAAHSTTSDMHDSADIQSIANLNKGEIENVSPDIPSPPDYEIHSVFPSVESLISKLDWNMLIHRFMGAKSDKKDDAQSKIEAFLQTSLNDEVFSPASVFRYIKAKSFGDDIVLLSDDNRELTMINFFRNHLNICAADWIVNHETIFDNLAIFVVTAGDVSKHADKARLSNKILYAYALEALAIAFTEANANFTHEIIRNLWNIDNHTQGVRLSPGYSCCPDLTVQKSLFDLLRPESIGIQLTDEYMMDPEGSISAIVFHHKEGQSY